MINKKCLPLIVLCLSASSAALAESTVPYGNSSWVYDATYDDKGKHLTVQAGLFVDSLSKYNQSTSAAHQITQVLPYGGNLEMYCAGSGESPTTAPCLPNTFLINYYPPAMVSKKNNNWDYWYSSLGDSGFRSAQAYKNVAGVKQVIVTIDGRVDSQKNGQYDYLDHLNTLSEQDARRFADITSKAVCADDNIDGVQFDIEPFSFTGDRGSFTGPGQKYFYTRIAENLAGKYSSAGGADPIGCVDSRHPNGRIFSVFAFSDDITPDVVSVLTRYGNGYVVDSLYDLGPQPGGQLTPVDQFKTLVANEISKIRSKNVPYQLAIPAAASAHEFQWNSTFGNGVSDQNLYVTAALDAIKSVRGEANFKGVAIWSWNSAMWWGGMNFTPASPPASVLEDLKNNM